MRSRINLWLSKSVGAGVFPDAFHDFCGSMIEMDAEG
jgi:hypothetical protein